MTSGVRCLLKGTDTSINGVLDPLNLIFCLISDPNCLTRNLTNPLLAHARCCRLPCLPSLPVLVQWI